MTDAVKDAAEEAEKETAEALYKARENWFANSRLPPRGSIIYWPSVGLLSDQTKKPDTGEAET